MKRREIKIKYEMMEEWWKRKYEITISLFSRQERHILGM
jgi:hypothetical protein